MNSGIAISEYLPMKLKKARNTTVMSSSGSTRMKDAAAALSAMPIGTASSSSTKTTVPTMCIALAPLLSIGGLVSAFFFGLLGNRPPPQLLNREVQLEQHG